MDKVNRLTSNQISVIVSKKEYALLELLHEIGWGRVVIHLEDKQPVRIEEGIKSRKL